MKAPVRARGENARDVGMTFRAGPVPDVGRAWDLRRRDHRPRERRAGDEQKPQEACSGEQSRASPQSNRDRVAPAWRHDRELRRIRRDFKRVLPASVPTAGPIHEGARMPSSAWSLRPKAGKLADEGLRVPCPAFMNWPWFRRESNRVGSGVLIV